MPVIGPSARSNDIIYAFGHGHVGMSAGATTGRIVADLIAGRRSHIPIDAFSPGRFSSRATQRRVSEQEAGRTIAATVPRD
jgi:D-amino-acid dehydrogenase